MTIPDAPLAPARAPSLRDRAQGLIDRLLLSRRFQAWATAFPLTRPVARRRARALFDLCAGFVYSQVLLAAVRTRLAEVLADGPATPAQLAPRLGLPPAGAERLLRAAAALHIAAPRGGGRYGLGRLGAALVSNPGIGAMVEHHALLYGDLADPVALLRGERGPTRMGAYWPYAGAADPAAAASAQDSAPYTALMAASQPMVTAEILAAYDLRRHRHLLDVGGGNGTFLTAVAAQAPALTLTLVDLPPVAAAASARFAAAGLADRARAVGADVFRDPLPTGADVATLVRVLHDHDDPAALAILRAVRAALTPGGTLLVAEPMAGVPGAEAMGDAYFGFYLMAMGQGRPRTQAELATLMQAAGFTRIRPRPTRTPLLTGVMTAEAAVS